MNKISVLERELEKIERAGSLSAETVSRLMKAARFEVSTSEDEMVFDLKSGIKASTIIVSSDSLFTQEEVDGISRRHKAALDAAAKRYKAIIKGAATTILTAGTAYLTGGSAVPMLVALKGAMQAARTAQLENGETIGS